jgi:hypothetical protein
MAVIGGSGLNYGKRRTVHGADLLGYYIRHLVALGFTARTALRLARMRLRLKPRQTLAVKDALEFEMFT